jgi:starvation-inducible DNA-binding protein
MIGDLVHDHHQLATCLRELVETAEHARDPATADLATERVAFHEKAA